MTRSSPAVRQRPGGRSARVRAAVLEAAVDELAATGVAGFSLDRVARHAQVHKATVYRRWGSREGLVLDVMRQQAQENVLVPDTGELREDLIRLATSAVRNAVANQAVLRAFISELPHNPAVARAARTFWKERLSLDGQIVERAIARGDIPHDTDSRSVIEGVLGALHLRFLITGKPADRKTITRTVDLILNGLRGPR
jgi:AcrR family transcriptional regulator